METSPLLDQFTAALRESYYLETEEAKVLALNHVLDCMVDANGIYARTDDYTVIQAMWDVLKPHGPEMPGLLLSIVLARMELRTGQGRGE